MVVPFKCPSVEEDQTMQLKTLLKDIQSDNPEIRTAAWQQAHRIGAPAVKPLAALYGNGDLEVARAAKRGLERIVRAAGAPEAACLPPSTTAVSSHGSVVASMGAACAATPLGPITSE